MLAGRDLQAALLQQPRSPSSVMVTCDTLIEPSSGGPGSAAGSCSHSGSIWSLLNWSITCSYLICTSWRCWSQSISSLIGPGRSL